jgi:hypothetical protein
LRGSCVVITAIAAPKSSTANTLIQRICRGLTMNMPNISTTITTGNTAPRPAPSSV